MAIAWFIIPYKRHPVMPRTRYPAIDDHTASIRALGGDWSETEVLGNRCLVKVRAPANAIEALATRPGYKRLPKIRLGRYASSPCQRWESGVRSPQKLSTTR